MKRSDMVERLIDNVLALDGFLNYSYGGHEMPTSYREIAEEVIDYLVSQGMRPPDTGLHYAPDYIWEDEDI